jgi:CheY-like chemotaxis protein
MNMQVRELVWPSASESWIGITAGSGWNQDPAGDQPSDSRLPSEEKRAALPQILIVEDNSADVFLIRAAIRRANIAADLHVLHDGEVAMQFIDRADNARAAPCPDILILDINLPRKSGGEVLEHLRKSVRCGHARVLVVSTSDSAADRETMSRLGANAYFHKPSDYVEFMKLGDVVKELLGI